MKHRLSYYLKTHHPFVWRQLSNAMRFGIRISKRRKGRDPLPAPEVRRYSQNGEDGVLLEIFSKIKPVSNGRLVEIGIEDGRECNSRNLIMNYGWSGVLVDCMPFYTVLARDLYRKYPVDIKTMVVEPSNINDLVMDDLDMLSIDVDGMDYWIWDAMRTSPRVVMIEYNARLEYEKAVVTEYRANFNRAMLPENGRLAGASYQALEDLGTRKGYTLVYQESSETNLFFVRNDLREMVDGVFTGRYWRGDLVASG